MTNARDRRRVQGGNNYHLKYNRVFGGLLVEGSYSKHNGEVSDFAVVPGARNGIVFRETDVRRLEDEQLGGFGLDDLDQRDTEGFKGTAVVQLGRHAVHGGVEFMRNTNFRDTVYDGGLYVSPRRWPGSRPAAWPRAAPTPGSIRRTAATSAGSSAP